MKGQFSIDVYAILILFITIVAYLFFQLLTVTPSYMSEIGRQRLQVETYQISELLINDLGEPIDWNTRPVGEIKRIGLSDQTQNKTNLLSLAKINALNSTCNTNYPLVASKLGITDYQFSIIVTDLKSGTILVSNCRPSSITSRAVVSNITRTISISPDSYGQLILQMW